MNPGRTTPDAGTGRRIPAIPTAGPITTTTGAMTTTAAPTATLGRRIPIIPVAGEMRVPVLPTTTTGRAVPTTTTAGRAVPTTTTAGRAVPTTTTAGRAVPTTTTGRAVPTTTTERRGTGIRMGEMERDWTPPTPIVAAPTVTTPITTVERRIPVIPTADGVGGVARRIPIIPTATGVGRPVAVVPVAGTSTPIIPVLPVVLEPPEVSLPGKYVERTYDVYDTIWKDKIATPSYGDLSNGIRFAEFFRANQRFYDRGVPKYVIEYLMTEVAPEFIVELAAGLGFRQLKASIDVFYNLLWYLNFGANAFALRLNELEIDYISGLETPEQLNLLGPNYHGPQDKASLLFALVSGQASSRPDPNDLPRYESVKLYPPAVAWKLAMRLYNIISQHDIEGEISYIVDSLPPYVYIANQVENAIENIVASVNDTNIESFLHSYQIALAPGNRKYNVPDKINYFIQEIIEYGGVFERPENLIPPPVVKDMDVDLIHRTLRFYTLQELVDAYEPTQNWTSRKELIQNIIAEAQGGSIWSWRNRHCNNDATMNTLEFLPHGEIDKNDPMNPTLSYGIQKNYRCYQVDELVAAFSNNEGFFKVPDYDAQHLVIDATTGRTLAQYFPVPSMDQLAALLERAPVGYSVAELRNRLRINFDLNRRVVQVTRQLQVEYDAKSPAEQYLIRIYLGWAFLFAMWMRFWKGPGYEWPTFWVEQAEALVVSDRCTEYSRDWHVKLQSKVRDFLRGTMSAYPGLVDWVDQWPLINYNFHNNTASIAKGETLKSIIDIIQQGKFCLAHASDLVSQSAYYLTIRILNLPTSDVFNDFLREVVPPVSNLESQTITWLLANPNANDIDEAVLRQRQTELSSVASTSTDTSPAPEIVLPKFEPHMLELTRHTDPDLGTKLRFD